MKKEKMPSCDTACVLEDLTSKANRVTEHPKSLMQANQQARCEEKHLAKEMSMLPDPMDVPESYRRRMMMANETRERYRRQWVDPGNMTYHKSHDEVI